MKEFEETQYTVSTTFVCAIVNDDWTGLSEEDDQQLHDFMYTLPMGSFSPTDMDQEPDFKRCEVCGLDSDCIEFTLLVEV
jgi:hypothetical protein